jgi:hypothetical protein
MSSLPPSQKHWQAIIPDQMIEIALVQVKLSYQPRTTGDGSRDLRSVWDGFRNSFHAIAELHGGKLLSWHGQDGSFMFLIENDASFDNCCVAAIQMFDMVPSINEDIRVSTDVEFPIEACILCDTGKVAYNPEPMQTAGDFLDQCHKYCHNVRTDSALIVTGRVHCQLSPSNTSRFVTAEFSPELDTDLHSTIALSRSSTLPSSASRTLPPSTSTAPSNPVNPLSQPALVEKSAAPQIAAAEVAGKLASVTRFVKRLPTSVKPWQKIAIGLVAASILRFTLDRFLPPIQTTTRINPALSSPECLAWQKHARKVLAKKPVTDASLIEALRDLPMGDLLTEPERLRRDQAVAAELLSEPGVAEILQKRFVIDEHFLGMGSSKTRNNEAGYKDAVIHEYLIPNFHVELGQVWVRRFNFHEVQARQAKSDTVEQVIEEESESSGNRDMAELKKTIIELMKTSDSHKAPRPVIRFARLDRKYYRNRLGKDERFRVFASNLSEVWKRKFTDAADLSGYNSKSGDSFFIFIFLPANPDEAVPATWGEVLKHIPIWFQEANEGVT